MPARRPAASGRRRRRHPLVADLRQRVHLFRRRARRGAVESEHRVGRNRRTVDPQPHLDRQRTLQVDGRRTHVDPLRPRLGEPHRAHRRSIRRIPTSCSSPRRVTATARSRSAESIARRTAARRGTRCSSSTRTRARSTSSCTRPTRKRCSPRCGSSSSTRGDARAAARGAESTSRTTAATTGRSSRDTACPTHEIGKVGLAISRSNPNRVYALIETGDGNPLHGRPTDNGELWRSEDGGVNWKVISFDRDLACRQPYYTRMAVAPDNPDETYFLCATFNHSMDGGSTLTQTGRGGGGGRGRGGAAPRRREDAARHRRRRSPRLAATTTTSGSIRRIRRAWSSAMTRACTSRRRADALGCT